MEHKRFIVLAICLLVACGQANPATEKSTSTLAPLNKEIDPSTVSSTTPLTTTTAPPPTTTTAPTTSTTAPTTSTAAPTTSTPSPVTTTPAPKPEPKPEKGLWAYTNSTNNQTCIIVQMSLQFNITYKVKDQMSHAVFNLPVNKTKTSDGSCGDTNQNITLTWPSDKNDTNMLILNFEKNTTSNKFSLSTLKVIVFQDNTSFPQANDANKPLSLAHTDNVFNAPLTMSYRCGKVQNITLNGNESLIFINDVQIQAFHSDKGYVFGSAVDCDYVDVPDIVPIAVGCALGALVLIVLIAYLVGRRRNRARGYLSM